MLKKASLTLMAAAAGVILVQGQQRPAGPFTAAQASDGRAAYQENCSGCHLPDLAGRNEAPPLAGGNFMNTWGGRTTRELLALIQTTMPPGSPGVLGADVYAEIAAFILQSNGATPGNQPLTTATAVTISSVATGQAPAGGRGAGAGGGRGAAGGGRGGARPAGPRGITVAGEVKNYVPVTDEMLPQSRSGRLADRPRQLSGLEPQRAGADHRRQREGPAAGLGLEHERQRGGQRAHAARPQRHHLSVEHRQHRAGARRAHRRPDLGKPHAAAEESTGGTGAMRNMAIYQDKVSFADHRRASVRPRRAHRQNRLGRHHRRQPQGLRRTPAGRSSFTAR